MTPDYLIRRIRSDEADKLRDVRLRALADSPEAFGSTYRKEAQMTAADWAARTAESAPGLFRTTYIAESGDEWVGMAVGYVASETPDRAEIFGVWVAPSARGHGVGLALVEAVVSWAASRGVCRVELRVVTTNSHAIALYRRAGFEDTGHREPMPRDPAAIEVLMVKDLAGPAA